MPECDGCRAVKHDAEEKITALEKLVMLRIDGVENVHEVRFVASGLALELQTGEIKRRLDDLNGEAGRLRKMQESYLPRETYDVFREKMLGDVGELKAHKDTAAGRNSIVTVVVSAAISLAASAIGYFALHRGVTP